MRTPRPAEDKTVEAAIPAILSKSREKNESPIGPPIA
jgi:hypothetical protein